MIQKLRPAERGYPCPLKLPFEEVEEELDEGALPFSCFNPKESSKNSTNSCKTGVWSTQKPFFIPDSEGSLQPHAVLLIFHKLLQNQSKKGPLSTPKRITVAKQRHF